MSSFLKYYDYRDTTLPEIEGKSPERAFWGRLVAGDIQLPDELNEKDVDFFYSVFQDNVRNRGDVTQQLLRVMGEWPQSIKRVWDMYYQQVLSDEMKGEENVNIARSNAVGTVEGVNREPLAEPRFIVDNKTYSLSQVVFLSDKDEKVPLVLLELSEQYRNAVLGRGSSVVFCKGILRYDLTSGAIGLVRCFREAAAGTNYCKAHKSSFLEYDQILNTYRTVKESYTQEITSYMSQIESANASEDAEKWLGVEAAKQRISALLQQIQQMQDVEAKQLGDALASARAAQQTHQAMFDMEVSQKIEEFGTPVTSFMQPT